MSRVPEHWIPLIPVHVAGQDREISCSAAAMLRVLEGDPDAPRAGRPRTSLLRAGLDHAPDGVLPARGGGPACRRPASRRPTSARAGATAARGVWLGVRKQTGRGEGSSGLAFDRLIDQPNSGAG